MLYSSKTTLAASLGIDRRTIDTLIGKGEVKRIEDTRGRKYYVHILNHIKELLD